MITALIIIIIIVALSKYLFAKGNMKQKFTSNFGVLLLTFCMFLVVDSIMRTSGGSNVKFGLALTTCIGFFILDVNLIMSGSYNYKGKGESKENMMTEDAYVYASMRLFTDFILIFVLLVQLLAGDS